MPQSLPPPNPCSLIREFEREARTDGMPPNELNFRKKQYVQELNGFIGLKKAYSGQAGQRAELLDGAKTEAEQLQGAARRDPRAACGAARRAARPLPLPPAAAAPGHSPPWQA